MNGEFRAFFRRALDLDPFPFQERFARELDPLVSIPTGLGKTAMVVVGWLWRRHGASDEVRGSTPRRLIYCLPMRVLVEQTRDSAARWLNALGLTERVGIHVLMGGEDEEDWDLQPERDALVIGTQDMLLSRALNRGYAASRARWPMKFGLLHTDCLWVFDELQLMRNGLATTAQLEAFRRTFSRSGGQGCRSVWMSATLRREWLATVDFRDGLDDLALLELAADDRRVDDVKKRLTARKQLTWANARIGDTEEIAAEVRAAHRPGTRTIVVVNTVRRARELCRALAPSATGITTTGRKKVRARAAPPPDTTAQVVLLHSRFRPLDRKRQIDAALGTIDRDGPGMIVVSTQVIEAGVDVSATTLFTELAPWSSLVQRFGRCDRRGEDRDARVLCIDLPKDVEGKAGKSGRAERPHAPYQLSDLKEARGLLEQCGRGVGPAALAAAERSSENAAAFAKAMRFEHEHVLRLKDLTDLFDTTPDLAGLDLDVDRFVRGVEDSDVRAFWRRWDPGSGDAAPPDSDKEPAPVRAELCPAPIGEFRDFAKDRRRRGRVWRWNFRDQKWEQPPPAAMVPGQVFLVHADAGGYSESEGWVPDSDQPVRPVDHEDPRAAPDASDGDPTSRGAMWQTIGEHAEDVCREMERVLEALPSLPEREAAALRAAARWHDRGKAHPVFQDAIDDGQESAAGTGQPTRRRERPGPWQGCRTVAKAPDGMWRRYGRRHFRHELASALAVLDPRNAHVADELRDLVAYLVAAHHGKVRLSIRSLPGEQRPGPSRIDGAERRFARGVWDGDALPETDLGDGAIAPAATLSLEPMELGSGEEGPFAEQPSWAERMLGTRERLGLFRLAYLEALLRAADMCASRAAEGRAPADTPGSARGSR